MKKVVIITGGGGGIGLETAKQYLGGETVLIADISETSLQRGRTALEALGIETHTQICDVSNPGDLKALFEKGASLGQITDVIHTAGISSCVPNVELILKIDLLGTAALLETLLPYAHENMSVVCIASMMSMLVPPSDYDAIMLDCLAPGNLEKLVAFAQNDPNAAYNIAKRGVKLLCLEWAGRFSAKGARVNSISPGIIETPMAMEAFKNFPEYTSYMQSLTPLGRIGLPSDIAAVAKFLCSSAASFITGTDILVDGGLIHNLIKAQRAACPSIPQERASIRCHLLK